MLSVSVQVHPTTGTAKGCIRYHADSPFDLLKVHSVSTELGVSVMSGKKVLHQFSIRTPKGLFKSFFASIEKEPSLLPKSKERSQLGDADCDDLISKLSALTATERNSSTETETDDIQTNLSAQAKERPEGDSELLSEFSALAAFERDSNLPKSNKLNNQTGEPSDLQFTELFFGLRLMNPDMLDDVLSDLHSPTVKEFLTDTIKVGMRFDILCGSCGQILTVEALNFEKVEECCEGLTSELSDSFFCHAKLPAVSVVMPRSLYFDSACFYLHRLITDKLNIQDLDSNRYACGGCGSLLTSGSKPVQGYTQFFCDKIQFHLSDSSPVDLSYPFKMAWVSLWSFIERALETSLICKLYLHSKGVNKETCLLLWVLPEKVPCFHFQATSSMQTDFKTENVYQVSYLTCEPSSTTVRTWRHDFDVDFYKVSDSAMSVIIQYLSKASVFFQKRVDRFTSSFLPTSFPGTQVFQ